MNRNSLKSLVCFLGVASVLAACGGSTDDEAGAPAPLAVHAATTAWTSGVATCPPLTTTPTSTQLIPTRVLITGGTAPYRIEVSFPNQIGVSTQTVGNRNGTFDIFLTGGCVDPGIITVIDSLNVWVELRISYKPTAEE